MNAIRAVLFDAGGVVLRNRDNEGRILWTLDAFEDLGLTEDDIRTCYVGNGTEGRGGFSEVLTGKLDTLEYFEKVFEKEPFKSSRVNAQEFVNYWLDKDSLIDFRTLALVDRVSVPRYMATNQDALRLARIDKLVGSHFSSLFASCNLGVRKPSQEYFTRITDILELPPSSILFIDDDPRYIAGAASVGMNVHLFTDHQSLEAFLIQFDLLLN